MPQRNAMVWKWEREKNSSTQGLRAANYVEPDLYALLRQLFAK